MLKSTPFITGNIMNLLKPFLIGVFAFFAIGLNAQTQEAATQAIIAQYSQENLDLWTTELSLTADQVEQISYLNEKVVGKIQAIQDNAGFPDEKKREFIRGNREDHKRVMSSILTPQQYDDYLDLTKANVSSQNKPMQGK
ncbi:MAG: hypothetical protein HWE22_08395 [Flavobacteriales bacterium]|nr:hypothetical protein [Flavobacteriales bacterium]